MADESIIKNNSSVSGVEIKTIFIGNRMMMDLSVGHIETIQMKCTTFMAHSYKYNNDMN